MGLKYKSGVEIRKGDRVLQEADWYVQEYGGGVMVVEPKAFGRVFISGGPA